MVRPAGTPSDRKDSKDRVLAAALNRLDVLNRQDAFDPNDPTSKPTPAQSEVIADFGTILIQWIAASNRSGKTATVARIVGWILTDRFPGPWQVPQSWKDTGIFVLVAARTGKHIEESLWPKIKVCLPEGSYKEVRASNGLQKVDIIDGPCKGSKIVFQSLENPKVARERLQSYDAHIAWLDELVDSASLIAEIMMRVTTKGGSFLASFTPLIPAPAVKKMVDGAALPLAKRYTFKAKDNPVFHDPIKWDLFLATMVDVPADERETRLEGTWSQGTGLIYKFDSDTMIRMPENYSPLWRHVEVVDPATESKLGLGLFAEDPATAEWYMIKADYVKGIHVPTLIIEEVQKKVAGTNVVRRVSDPNATWYIHQASAAPYHLSYMGVYKKNDRKQELITGLQQALGKKLFIAPHCEDAVGELLSCRRNDAGKIAGGSRFHLADVMQYFCDNIPKALPQSAQGTGNSWQANLYAANEKRKVTEQKVKDKVIARITIRRGGKKKW